MSFQWSLPYETKVTQPKTQNPKPTTSTDIMSFQWRLPYETKVTQPKTDNQQPTTNNDTDMKKRQYIHPQIEIVVLTDCNELLSGTMGAVTGGMGSESKPDNPELSKQSSFSIFDDPEDIYDIEDINVFDGY